MRKTIIITAFITSISAIAQTEALDSISTRQLNEVVVKVEKPQVRAEDGIMVVDLPEIVKDKPVNNILEALGYMPGVTNNNGMIWLTGASNVTIMLNGELTNMPLQNLYQLLYNTPVDRLKNVEVMYSAPAKYHVNGAVINVVLKTPTPLDGLQGQVRTGYNQAHYGSYGGALAAIYAVKDCAVNCGAVRKHGRIIYITASAQLLRTICGASVRTGEIPYSPPHHGRLSNLLITVRLSPIQRVGIFHRAPWETIRMHIICCRR